MDIKEFKLIKNRARPDFCYQYVKKTEGRKYYISTFDGGKSFSALIEDQRLDNKWYTEFSKNYSSIQECLDAFKK